MESVMFGLRTVLWDIFTGTVEYKKWGWNLVAVSVIGTIVLTFVVARALWTQHKKILLQRSGDGLSVTWFAYFAAVLVALIFYGIYQKSAAIIFNGVVLGAFHALIVIDLFRFGTWTANEKTQVFTFIFLPALMILNPLLFVLFGSMLVLWFLYKEKEKDNFFAEPENAE